MELLLISLLAISLLRAPAQAAVVPSPDPSPSSSPVAQGVREFSDEIDRDFNLRSIAQLQLSNLRGNITVIGWSQDKIRIHAHRRVYVESQAAAKTAFSAMDFLFQENDSGVECSARYGRGLQIHERVEERGRPLEFQSKMDMTVYAPSKLKAKLWTAAGSASLKNWNNTAELRTVSGDIEADGVTGEKISTLCQNCSVKFHAINGSIRAITDGGNISMADVEGPDVFVESGAGNLSAQDVRGDQIYVTKSGNIRAKELRGHVEFQTQEGSVDIQGLRGFASGKTSSGAIHLRANGWEFHDKAIIESVSGEVVLSLPAEFAAEVDLHSRSGRVECAFPIHYGNQPSEASHLMGRIGEQTTDLLRVFSDTGNIRILRLVR
jgi:DUF4097 and DUF4098 domain-containing protein YvlB